MRLPAVTFWSWEHALHDPSNQLYPGTELWDAIARHDFRSHRRMVAAGTVRSAAATSD